MEAQDVIVMNFTFSVFCYFCKYQLKKHLEEVLVTAAL